MPTYKPKRAGNGQKDAYDRDAQTVAEENGCTSYRELEDQKGVDEARALVQQRVSNQFSTGSVVSRHDRRFTDGLPGDYVTRSTTDMEENS